MTLELQLGWPDRARRMLEIELMPLLADASLSTQACIDLEQARCAIEGRRLDDAVAHAPHGVKLCGEGGLGWLLQCDDAVTVNDGKVSLHAHRVSLDWRAFEHQRQPCLNWRACLGIGKTSPRSRTQIYRTWTALNDHSMVGSPLARGPRMNGSPEPAPPEM